VGHAQWVFTIPKILRAYFLRNRELLGDLSRAAWQTVRALMAEAAGDPGVRPGMVVVPQTFGSSVNVHPHVHAIASRGGWTKDGTWVPIPYIDSGAAARLFRHKVLRLLLAVRGNGLRMLHVSPAPSCTPGDVNGNGRVTAADAALVLTHVAGGSSLGADALCAADYNGDGAVTTQDAVDILACVVGKCPNQ
jgi:Dockerin type I domain/Putative transposase